MPHLDDLLDVDAVALLAARRALTEARFGPGKERRLRTEPSEALAAQVLELVHGQPLDVAIYGLARALRELERSIEAEARKAAAPVKSFEVRVRRTRRRAPVKA